MKINLIVVDELGTDYIAETIDSNMQQILGDNLEKYIEFRLHDLADTYPEALGVYREDEKTLGEQRCEEYDRRYQENLEYALTHEDELDGYDPYEWADETTRDEMDNEWW